MQGTGGKKRVGGHAGEISVGLGYKALDLLLAPFLCRASLSSGKEASEVRYGIWSQCAHLPFFGLRQFPFLGWVCLLTWKKEAGPSH